MSAELTDDVTELDLTVLPAALTEVAISLDALFSWLRRNAPVDGYSMTARGTLGRLLADGPARVSDLVKLEGVTQPAMTGLINRLEAEQLVRREPDPRDARAALVVLTETGRRFIAERRAVRANLLATQLSSLSVADQHALVAARSVLDRLATLPRSQPELR